MRAFFFRLVRGRTREKAICVMLLLFASSRALPSSLLKWDDVKIKSGVKSAMENDKLIYSIAEVQEFEIKNKKYQSLQLVTAGLHSKSCRFSLRKLRLYESYKEFLSFVKESDYDEDKKLFSMLVSSDLLPFKIRSKIIIDRLKKVGVYPFEVQIGFLKGLKGSIHASEYKKRCFIYLKADWSGPETSLGESLFEFFTSSIMKLGLENLFRISSTY